MSTRVDRRRRRRGVNLRSVGNVILTVTAIIGSICIVATVAAVVLDVRPLVFRSGSMAPSIDTGSLAVARTVDADDVRIGDVVSVLDAQGVRITHRIETVTVRDGTATLVLKGDANAAVDDEPYVVTTADRVLFDIPRAGYVVSWMSGPVGVFLGGLLVGGILLSTIRSSRRGSSGGGRRAALVVAVLAIGAGASPRVGAQSTLAAFTDRPTMTSGTLSSYKVPTTTMTCAVTGFLGTDIKLTWTAVPGAVSYTLVSGQFNVTVNAPTTTYTFTPVLASGSATVAANRAFGSPVTTTWTAAPSNAVGFAALVGAACT
ncbi:MAG: signal peptidase I [Aeromicrobium sp.]